MDDIRSAPIHGWKSAHDKNYGTSFALLQLVGWAFSYGAAYGYPKTIGKRMSELEVAPTILHLQTCYSATKPRPHTCLACTCKTTLHSNVFNMHEWLMPQSHQPFRPVPAVKLLGTMFRNRCWPTTVHTIVVRDADGWCLKWLVCEQPLNCFHTTWATWE